MKPKPTPEEHKTVQSRTLEYAEAIGWTVHFNVANHGKLWKSLMRAHLSD